jgi:DNA-binding Lrp family transcriptional regulator
VIKIEKKELDIIMHLRRNGRESITNISRETKLPISTIYERLKKNKFRAIKKTVTLIDFAKLGFNCVVKVAMKVKKEDRSLLKDHLMTHPNLNNLYKINNGFDFLVECVFNHVKEVEEFLDTLDSRFNILEKKVYYVIEELVKENFLSDPIHRDIIYHEKKLF